MRWDIASLDRALIGFVLLLEAVLVFRTATLMFRLYLVVALLLSVSWLVAPIPPDGAKWGIPLTAWIVGLLQSAIALDAAHWLTKKIPQHARRKQFQACLWCGGLFCLVIALGNPAPYLGYPSSAYYPRLFGACFGFAVSTTAALFCYFDRDPRPPRALPHAIILALYLGGIFVADRAPWAPDKLLVNTIQVCWQIGCMIAWLRLYAARPARS